MNDEVIVRNFDPDLDGSFIFKSWRDSLWFEDHPTQDERTEESYRFYRETNKYIKAVLRNSVIKIACSRKDPEFIYGYSIIQDHTLLWVYVKIEYRRNGIAKLLASSANKIGEPQTKVGIDVKAKLEGYIKARREDNQKKSDRIREISEPMPSSEQDGASL